MSAPRSQQKSKKPESAGPPPIDSLVPPAVSSPSAKAATSAHGEVDESAKWEELRSQIGDVGKLTEVAVSSSEALARTEEDLASFCVASHSSLKGTGNEAASTVSCPPQLFDIATPGDELCGHDGSVYAATRDSRRR